MDIVCNQCGLAELLHELRNPTSQTSYSCCNIHSKQHSTSSLGTADFACREVWNQSCEVIPLTQLAMHQPQFKKRFKNPDVPVFIPIWISATVALKH